MHINSGFVCLVSRVSGRICALSFVFRAAHLAFRVSFVFGSASQSIQIQCVPG